MSTSADLQRHVTERLGAPGALRVEVPRVARRTKDLGAEIEAAASRHGLCVWVMPPLPTGAELAPFVFFNETDFRVRVIEETATSAAFGADAYAIANDVMTALHWKVVPGLAHPLYLQARCTEMVEGRSPENGRDYRIIDVMFNAVYPLPPRRAVTPFDALGLDVTLIPDLQEALALQLAASGHLSVEVPILRRRQKTLESDIEAAAAEQVLCLEVLPERALRAMQGVEFVFIEQGEVRVRITEVPAMNDTGVDAYDLIEEVCTALHWQTFGERLPQPLRLAPVPVAEIEDGPGKRVFEVIFHAIHQLNSFTAAA